MEGTNYKHKIRNNKDYSRNAKVNSFQYFYTWACGQGEYLQNVLF